MPALSVHELHSVGESRLLCRVHHSLERLHLAVYRRHVATVRGQIERGTIYVSARDKNLRFRWRMDLARQYTIGPNPPVLRTAILLE